MSLGYCRTLGHHHVNGKHQHSYGIEMVSYTKGKHIVIDGAYDLTTDWEKVSYYTDTMNEGQLSPLHFWDVIEDMLLDDRWN